MFPHTSLVGGLLPSLAQLPLPKEVPPGNRHGAWKQGMEAELRRESGSSSGGLFGRQSVPCSQLPISCHFLVFPTVVASVFSSLLSLSVLSFSLSPASCDSLCLPRLSWSASPSPSPHHAPRPLPSLEAQGLGLGGLPAWARGPEWKTVVQTAPPAPTIPQGLSRLSWGLKPPPGPNPNPAQVTPCPLP